MNDDTTTPLEEVLHRIATEETELTHDALIQWVMKHPEHRDELADYFATQATRKSIPAITAEDKAMAGQLMVSKALNHLYKMQQAAPTIQEGSAKAVRLCDAVKECGLSEQDFEAKSGLDDLIIAKLDRRLVRVFSIPLLCFERIARALRQSLEDIRAMVSGDPIPLHSYKAAKQPEVKVEDFADAVRASNLPPDAKNE
jgi:hypothetical protein